LDRYINAIRKMRDGSCMLIDGATATELERRGVPQLNNAWNGGGALSHPDILKNIHSEYIKLGAKLIISNTFATCKHTLEDAKQSHNFQKLNSEGVRIAIEARSELNADEVLVAGGISYWSFTGRDPSLSRLKVNIYEQASLLADSGADLLILEMMKDIDRLIVTLEAAKHTKLPIWVGLSCDLDKKGTMTLLGGEPLEDAIKSLKGRDIDLLNIMHTDIDLVDNCLDVVKKEWAGLYGVYAHSGTMKNSNWAPDMDDTEWTFDDVVSPEIYSERVEGWISRGVHLVGGCCGISTDHMRHVAEKIHFE